MAFIMRFVSFALVIALSQLAQADNCEDAKHPFIILPGECASRWPGVTVYPGVLSQNRQVYAAYAPC
jgi:hypothetical protein